MKTQTITQNQKFIMFSLTEVRNETPYEMEQHILALAKEATPAGHTMWDVQITPGFDYAEFLGRVTFVQS